MREIERRREELKYLDELMKRGLFEDEDTGKPYFTGYDYKTLYDWDQYFEAIVQFYMGWDSSLIVSGVEIFLDHQREDGFISRSVPSNEWHDPEHVKPFLCQSLVMVARAYGTDRPIDSSYIPKLKAYLDYWLVDADSTGNGLSEWNSAPHTGMDNQHERAGWWEDRICKGVDLNSYIVREARAFAVLATMYGEPELAGEYTQKAQERADRINELLWNPEEGLYYDMHARTGELIKVKYVGTFAPMWAGIATADQAERLVHEHLLHADEFWSDYPVAVLAKSEPGYSPSLLDRDLGCCWRANTWIPTNYMVFHGLLDYGYDQIARSIALQTERLLLESGDREYYLSDSGGGCGLDPFWGWSLLGHFFTYEMDVTHDITRLTDQRYEAK